MDNIFQLIILIFSVIIHEVSHGYAALMLGDRTALNAGRLTLNPVPHIDIFGSVIIPALLVFSGSSFLIGWAKPVPYNENNLRNARWGGAMVAVAGPIANLFMALMFGFLLRLMPHISGSGVFQESFGVIISHIVLINIFLAIFNLLPIPPLDGSKVFFSFLPLNFRYAAFDLERQYGILPLLFILILFSSALSAIVFSVGKFIFWLFTGYYIRI